MLFKDVQTNQLTLVQASEEGIDEFEISSIPSKTIYETIFLTVGDTLSILGVYRDNMRKIPSNQPPYNANGIFFHQFDYKKRKDIQSGYIEFSRDFITQGWSDKEIKKALR